MILSIPATSGYESTHKIMHVVHFACDSAIAISQTGPTLVFCSSSMLQKNPYHLTQDNITFHERNFFCTTLNFSEYYVAYWA